jgi:hypothetical protein
MKLLEFFGKPLEITKDSERDYDGENDHLEPEEREHLLSDVYEYILNDDMLHKKFFLPVARTIHRNPAKQHSHDMWLPMINKGCMEFYKEKKLLGDPVDLFTKEFREQLCKKCADECQKHILMGEFNLGR